jgi:hypothetical protein
VRRFLVILTAVAAALGLSQGVASAGSVSVIWNNSTGGLGLGVDHIQEGVYAAGPYDGYLPNGARTDVQWGWGRAEAFYLATGECASVATRPIDDPSAPWKFFEVVGPFHTGFTWPTPDGFIWQVKRYLAGSSVCL